MLIDGATVWPPEDPDLAEFPAPVIPTLEPGKPLRVAFGSCRVSVSHDDQGTADFGVDALRTFALRMAGVTGEPEPWPDLVLFLGDQVYADDTSPKMKEFIAARRDPNEPPWTELKDYDEYAHLYRLAWSDPANRWLLSTLPSAMIFDDHDIRDDWNTSLDWRREMEATDWWHERIVAGLGSYWVHQHLGNLGPADRAEDALWQRIATHEGPGELDITQELDRLADRADQEPNSYRWSFSRDFDTQARLVVVDSRAARVLEPGKRSMLDDQELAWLDERMRGDVDHLIVGTSLPVLLAPALHHVEAAGEALAEGAFGRVGGRFGEWLRKTADFEHWAAFQEGFVDLARMTLEVASGGRGSAPRSVVFLSGDVHHSYVGAGVARPGHGREVRQPGGPGDLLADPQPTAGVDDEVPVRGGAGQRQADRPAAGRQGAAVTAAVAAHQRALVRQLPGRARGARGPAAVPVVTWRGARGAAGAGHPSPGRDGRRTDAGLSPSGEGEVLLARHQRRLALAAVVAPQEGVEGVAAALARHVMGEVRVVGLHGVPHGVPSFPALPERDVPSKVTVLTPARATESPRRARDGPTFRLIVRAPGSPNGPWPASGVPPAVGVALACSAHGRVQQPGPVRLRVRRRRPHRRPLHATSLLARRHHPGCLGRRASTSTATSTRCSYNGIDLVPLWRAELARRHPEYALLAPEDADGYREVWPLLEEQWAPTIARARALPEELLHERVDGEWSFIETLRHTLFVDRRLAAPGGAGTSPRPTTRSTWRTTRWPTSSGVPHDADARPSLDHVLALRKQRLGRRPRRSWPGSPTSGWPARQS